MHDDPDARAVADDLRIRVGELDQGPVHLP
jgi:hypothetical protein